jgi:hypothetical protein
MLDKQAAQEFIREYIAVVPRGGYLFVRVLGGDKRQASVDLALAASRELADAAGCHRQILLEDGGSCTFDSCRYITLEYSTEESRGATLRGWWSSGEDVDGPDAVSGSVVLEFWEYMQLIGETPNSG